MGYSWQFALTAVFLEGILFIIMTATNLREAIVNAIPLNLRYAISVGIGLFIAFIGLQNGGIIINNEATLVSLTELATNKNALLCAIGLIITSVLYAKKIRGAMLIGILATTLIGIPMGITQFQGFISQPESIAPIFCKFEWDKVFTFDMLIVVFTFFVRHLNNDNLCRECLWRIYRWSFWSYSLCYRLSLCGNALLLTALPLYPCRSHSTGTYHCRPADDRACQEARA